MSRMSAASGLTSSSQSVCARAALPRRQMPDPVDVVVEIGGRDVLAGRLWSHLRGRTESATFTYDPGYLAAADAYALDPSLPLVGGQLQTPADRGIFGAFSDCAPDRWGCRLIDRDERHRVEQDGGAARSFAEIDYLLCVRDDLRQGALRFRDPATRRYLAPSDHGIPYLIDLPTLLNASDHLERNTETAEELRMLLRGGSSLGGARPKAHVRSRDERIAIAKLPSPANDEWDVMRWEAVTLELAARSGIGVPAWELVEVERRAVLVVDRFDRHGADRVGYVSAMTMLEATDRDQASYLDIASVIERDGDDVDADLRELWRRIAFSILVSNTDDHLRNHGFLRITGSGWRLSPAFDLNPDPQPGPKRFSTAIEPGSPTTVETLMDAAPYFGISRDDAMACLLQVVAATSEWRTVAASRGLDRDAIDAMASAFETDEARIARDEVR